jgi:peptidoglycan/xylan/chitin deacetylase (PgdA/CDA1 family)
MKKIIKKFARYSGIFRLSAWMNNNTLKILMYHGFSHRDNINRFTNYSGKHLNIEEFEYQLKLLTKYCTPVTLDTVLTNEKLPPNPVALTFDDGYKNNYTLAYPLLIKYQVPATIFITTGFIDRTHLLWTDEIDLMILSTDSEKIRFVWQDKDFELKLSNPEEKTHAMIMLKKYAKSLSESDKTCFIDDMRQLLKFDFDWQDLNSLISPLTWEEIREMNNNDLISIGAHTVSHPILSKCSLEQQLSELEVSGRRISEELGTDCFSFAYPNGMYSDYNLDTVRLLKELGYKVAVTAEPGYINPGSCDVFQLYRFGGIMSIDELGTVVTGLSRMAGTI